MRHVGHVNGLDGACSVATGVVASESFKLNPDCSLMLSRASYYVISSILPPERHADSNFDKRWTRRVWREVDDVDVGEAFMQGLLCTRGPQIEKLKLGAHESRRISSDRGREGPTNIG